MSDIKSIFTIGQSALQAAKTSVEVTAQNIANINTPGYTKREVILATNGVTNGSPHFISGGVQVADIKRTVEEELSRQILNQEEKSGYWEIKKEYLGTLEEIFNESSGSGLNKDLSEFWSAWEDLSANPNGFGERRAVVSSANQVAETFQSYTQDFQEIIYGVREDMEASIEEINTILKKIADLNKEIHDSLGSQVNDYKDQLDKLIEDLSKKINIHAWQEENGRVNISVNGQPLVEGDQAYNLTYDLTGQDEMVLQKETAEGNLVDISDRLSGGKIKGLMELYNEIIPGFQDRFNTLAYTLAEKVNEQHQAGYSLDGSTNLDFFTPLDSVDGAAGLIKVNAQLKENPSLVAASSSSEIHDNENVLKILELAKTPLIEEDNFSHRLDDYYTQIQGGIGRVSKEAQSNTDHYQTVLQNLQDKRSMISDVSLDEELANLIKFQQTYNASAKIISTADEMMSTVIDLLA